MQNFSVRKPKAHFTGENHSSLGQIIQGLVSILLDHLQPKKIHSHGSNILLLKQAEYFQIYFCDSYFDMM